MQAVWDESMSTAHLLVCQLACEVQGGTGHQLGQCLVEVQD